MHIPATYVFGFHFEELSTIRKSTGSSVLVIVQIYTLTSSILNCIKIFNSTEVNALQIDGSDLYLFIFKIIVVRASIVFLSLTMSDMFQ